MKKLICSLILLSTLISNAQTLTATEFIDVAGKQRMLSQKIAKNFLIMTYAQNDPSFEQPAKTKINFKIATSVFARNLEMLKNSLKAYNKDLLKLLDKEEKSWQALSEEMNKEKTPENAVKVLQIANDLLIKSNDVVAQAEKQFANDNENSSLLNLINKSGKQRMLSQRLCLFFLYEKMEHDLKRNDKVNNIDLNFVFDEIDNSIGDLLVSKYNAAAKTDNLIGEVSVEFDVIKSKKEDFVSGKLNASEVYQITNKLTNLFNDLTFSYTSIR